MTSRERKLYSPLIYAHRGASKIAPENTLPSFELAADMKADGIELDIQITKDGHLVVIHDDKIDRTSNGTGLVCEHNLCDLKKLDFGSWKSAEYAKETIPLLSDVIKLAKKRDLLLDIEIKPSLRSIEVEEKVITICKSLDIVDRVVVSSFNHYCLRNIKKECKAIETAILYQSGIINAGAYARRTVKANGIHPHKYAIVAECIKSAVKNGMKIRPWMIESEDIFIKLAQIKYITAVVTNKPDVMRKILDENSKKL